MTIENLKQEIKEELFQIIRRLERNFNEQDEERFNELRTQYLTEPIFFREWMMYDRLVVLAMLQEYKIELKETYDENIVIYLGIKYASEKSESYQKELKAWKEANKIK
ncbi:hypothetical protein KY342_00500 [Candidatus Woesearchaeota archaeon]|nr:hypothetical protein [Candidatus Woesearchaeota archaeon]